MPPAKSRLSFTHHESKAIATVTTILSALIYKFLDGSVKEFLLIIVGFIGYIIYHGGIFLKDTVATEIKERASFLYADYRIKGFIRELEKEKSKPGVSRQRLKEIESESRNYREVLIQKRLDSLK
ncbi:hypothetical protein [Dyadobacter bucti]|uniref:hypothetical protein n=1 Tax=Dyadobacter bucti TaxID=2572203 RepID=UPI001107C358|nr:hypothetical protein [Dyadobacter bucti]